ncbi:hypothetical protein BDV12DRAFT_155549 [Aspergillus spectabilis]
MPIKALILSSRKPGLTLEEFRTAYEAHVQLIKRLAGDTFPLSHRRTYIARTTIEPGTDDPSSSDITTARNPTTPAIVVRGEQADFDFDATAELTFADQEAADRFMARIGQIEVAKQLLEDEERFLDRERVGIVMVGDVTETTN